jgi:hypothetical protein
MTADLATVTIDHKRARSRGGSNGTRNKVAACDGRNQAKGPLDAETFKRLRQDRQALKSAKDAATRAASQRAQSRAATRRKLAAAVLILPPEAAALVAFHLWRQAGHGRFTDRWRSIAAVLHQGAYQLDLVEGGQNGLA